ncbi:hypothetical protein D9757_001563 [Collybiopsis confluens]|uniref:Nudix hydrolase domain-containing protein n=1 Tax=Collybiopsis confluens TaxID=2823264 RepID=A0A8H5HZD5_9AGAR|nr:hypothetical protein D9757_001563 [Collybiopsis confluens]
MGSVTPIESSISSLDNLQLDSKTRQALQKLQDQGFEGRDLSSYLPRRLASVLVLLYSQAGILRVLLTTRSKNLRSHPGETALPGGRVDEGEEKDTVSTAFREANEEVNLPYPSSASTSAISETPIVPSTSHIHILCALTPHVAPWGIVITPVIAYLSSPSPTEPAQTFLELTLRANPSEVDRIFAHPLEAMVDLERLTNPEAENNDDDDDELEDPVRKLRLRTVKLVEKGSDDWPYDEEYYNFADFDFPRLDNPSGVVRLHRFRSTASPIEGLTANILMRVATIAYGKPPAPPIEPSAPK